MVKPSYVLPIELSQPFQTRENLQDYSRLRGLVQLWGDPLGWIEVPIHQGVCTARAQSDAVLEHYRRDLLKRLLALGLRQGALGGSTDLEALWQQGESLVDQPVPAVGLTIALCYPVAATADETRWEALIESLQAVRPQLGSEFKLEILVVGASPGRDRIEAWSHPAPNPGDACPGRYLPSAARELSELRNLALAQAQHEIIAFFSPQIQVTAAGLQAIARSFTEDPSVAAVSGPVLPTYFSDELQVLERHELMVRSFQRQWHRYTEDGAERWRFAPFNQSLSPDHFSLRRSALVGSEPFRPGAASLRSLIFDLCVQGKTVLYEPQAWLYGYADQRLERLEAEVRAEATARASYFVEGWLRPSVPPRYRYVFFKESLGILRWAGSSWFGANGLAKRLHGSEFKGALAGVRRSLFQHLRGPAGISAVALSSPSPEVAPAPAADAESLKLALQMAEEKQTLRERALGSQDETAEGLAPTAVRTLDLAQPIPMISEVGAYDRVRFFLTRGGKLLGSVELDNRHGPLTPRRLSAALVEALGARLLDDGADAGEQKWQSLELQLNERLTPPEPEPEAEQTLPVAAAPTLPDSVPISIIITTCDRPTDLRNCLRHLTVQRTNRPVEIIVADNRPASGITPPVVKEFPGVKLVSEPRVGGSYGRNSAFCASTGEIVVTVDDDVTVPPDWLEKLLAPMARPEVMVVTGNVLPRELETQAQQMYEDLYGGLSEGFEPIEADAQWLASFNYSPPVWDLGVSANSAFRASVFHHPEIGMMPEVLGPGTPVGGGEENYLIYRILKAGFTLVYEPSAYAWHRHRRTVPQLRYQIYRQMMGGTAYHILLWRVDKDPRGLQQLTRSLPRYFTQRLIEKIQGKHQVPWSFLGLEVAGYVSGIWGYWKSLQAVKRQGLSEPYVPVADRSPMAKSLETEVATPLG